MITHMTMEQFLQCPEMMTAVGGALVLGVIIGIFYRVRRDGGV